MSPYPTLSFQRLALDVFSHLKEFLQVVLSLLFCPDATNLAPWGLASSLGRPALLLVLVVHEVFSVAWLPCL